MGLLQCQSSLLFLVKAMALLDFECVHFEGCGQGIIWFRSEVQQSAAA